MTYYNGTKFTWTMGRRLETATRSNGSKVTYTYNADGLLTSKKVGIYKLNYYWNGDKLTAQTDGVNTWYFRYDGDTPISLEFNGIEYYYVTNLQGDVIAILDSNGAVAAEYSYDAWGNYTITKDTNTIAIDNPLRYRGYYYDAHIGLYYLQSRFYDANTGRFINADASEMIEQEVYNLFSYCDNDPVNKTDANGFMARWRHALKGIRLLALGLWALTKSIKKGFVIAALGTWVAKRIAWLIGVSLAALPLGQYWAVIVNVEIIISLAWNAKNILYNIPSGVWHLKQSIRHTHK